ncbi:MAG: diaminopimelate epimerase [Planctomycetes bacterium]|nr:diaminopimelate epimerase [Planctomycetota bacterium]
MKFFKMHGIGNDFILFVPSGKEQSSFTRPLIRRLCDRHSGIGADGVILVLPARHKNHDFRMRIFNADGSEAEMCGNGIRCLGKLVFEQGLTNKHGLIIETLSGNIPLKLLINRNKVAKVSVTLPAPSSVRKITASKIKVVLGNPHCVVFIDEDVSRFPVAKYGPLLERHHLFPQRTNVEFVRVKNRGAIDMRVWERGVGETLACGTGACAAVMAGIATRKLRNNKVKVSLPGGVLEISKLKSGKISLAGPAEMVFEGDIKLN